jgi:hypothetical protein
MSLLKSEGLIGQDSRNTAGIGLPYRAQSQVRGPQRLKTRPLGGLEQEGFMHALRDCS